MLRVKPKKMLTYFSLSFQPCSLIPDWVFKSVHGLKFFHQGQHLSALNLKAYPHTPWWNQITWEYQLEMIPHTVCDLCRADKSSLHTCHFSLAKKINQLHQGASFSSSLHWLSPQLNFLYNHPVLQLEASRMIARPNELASFFLLASLAHI